MERLGPRPNELFATRLRETRRLRDLTQQQLAERMTEAGQPMGRLTVIKIERGSRPVSLDEFIAFAAVLHAPPANLLSPSGDGLIGLTSKLGADGEGLRHWLLTGLPFLAWPDLPGEDPVGGLRVEGLADDQKRASVDRLLERALDHHATALVDAGRADDRHGQKAAGQAIVDAVNRYRATLEQLDRA